MVVDEAKMNRACVAVVSILAFALAGIAAVGAFRPKRKPREGWAEQFRLMAERGDDKLIELPGSSWDEDEWEW